VLVVGFPTGLFAANCYVVAASAGEQCVVIDPGQDAVPDLTEALREHGLRPAAVLVTHGHIDHMWSVLPVCGAHDVAAYIHVDDRDRLADPVRTLSPDLVAALGVAGLTFGEPADVRELTDGAHLDIAGLTITADHTPGHTQGSVVFRLPDGGPDGEGLMFSGDLLFAGSIGRTDNAGGDDEAMRASLARVLTLPDETVVLPGHGPSTTIGRERATNPHLRGLSGQVRT
jgi:glyoxylase-like metal-dependent hydrolase (beta-lactamase superfamily II)